MSNSELEAEVVRLREQVSKLQSEAEASRAQLQAWFNVFGTSQLTHARARLEAAEEKAARSQQGEEG